MAFKLGTKKIPITEYKNVFSGDRDTRVGGVDIVRVNMSDGTLGEAYKEGFIKIDKSIDPSSNQYRRVLQHEMKHMTDMKIGKTDYGDDYVKYNGVVYPRENGYIFYDGQWREEGYKDFPWEFKD